MQRSATAVVHLVDTGSESLTCCILPSLMQILHLNLANGLVVRCIRCRHSCVAVATLCLQRTAQHRVQGLVTGLPEPIPEHKAFCVTALETCIPSQAPSNMLNTDWHR